eukprot:2065061-Amphidinium_carterae.2
MRREPDISVISQLISRKPSIAALTRYRLPPVHVRVIRAIYTSPRFRVLLSGNLSSLCTQHTGIKRGCPLSPY